MDEQSAKQYLLGFITTYKLTIKKIDDIDSEIVKWNSRVELARSKGAADLAAEAEKETQRLNETKQKLLLEADELKTQISKMQRQFKTLGSYLRSVDPDLLEQELLMAAGYNPGDEEKLNTERKMRELENESQAQAALDELKAKMGKKD
jgi:phage shock protein A